MAEEFVTSINAGEIVLNNYPMKVRGPINYSLENTYGRKIHQGDPGPDDHPINSTITQSRWTGGIGTLKFRGEATQDNSWFSTFDTTISEALALPVKVYEKMGADFSEPNSYVYVHDKLLGTMWFTFGKKLKRWDEITETYIDPPTPRSTTETPIGPGVVWRVDAASARKLYIPTGASYEVFDGTGVPVAGTASERAIAFAVHEQKLFKLDDEGVVKVTVDGTTWAEKGRISDESTPKRLVIFYNREQKQVLHVTTTASVWALDFTNSTLIETDMQWPDHPYQGIAAERWRADLFVSVGIGIHRNVSGQIQPVGPDGRDGLPEEYSSGYFTGMRGSYNDLFALLRGTAQAVTPTPETADLYSGPPERMLADIGQAFAMLLGWNGLGWHVKWIGVREPTNVQVSSQSGVYRAFWGSLGAVYTRKLPIGYYNPLHSGEHNFEKERYAQHITPYFNYGFEDTPKIMKQLEMKTLQCDANNFIKVYYRTDDNEVWTELRIITTNGEHHINIGFEDIAGQSFHTGLAFERIQFMFEGFGDPADELRTPVIQWYTLVGRKWMRMVRTFRFQIDNSRPHKKDVKTINQIIFDAVTKKGGSTLVIGDTTYIVDLTSNSANIAADKSFASFPSLVAVETTEIDSVEING